MLIFSINLSLLLMHEMDAIRAKEWRMFAILQRMDDSKACRIFILLHLPLYAILLTALLSSGQVVAFYVLDTFLVVHTVAHLAFERHPHNGFKNFYSRMMIY
uniref:DUF6713 family protein n=1 Tax=Frankia tisae TaxID=2950104 RepID=UPI0027E38ED6